MAHLEYIGLFQGNAPDKRNTLRLDCAAVTLCSREFCAAGHRLTSIRIGCHALARRPRRCTGGLAECLLNSGRNAEVPQRQVDAITRVQAAEVARANGVQGAAELRA